MSSRNSVSRGRNMRRTAKIFMNNRNQAVRLPKEFQFNAREVFIRKEGNDVILSPRPIDWSSYIVNAPVASEAFMEGVGDLPVQAQRGHVHGDRSQRRRNLSRARRKTA